MKVLVVRSSGTPDGDVHAIEGVGAHVTADPYVAVAPCDDDAAPARAMRLLDRLDGPGTWLMVTSAAGLRALDGIAGADTVAREITRAAVSGTRFAAVGPTSARALAERGATGVLVPRRPHTATALLEALAAERPSVAVLPRSDIGDPLLPRVLTARGWEVLAEVVYRTRAVAQRPVTADPLAAGEFDAVVLRSPSAVRAVASFARVPERTRVVAGGPTTALAATRAGLRVAVVSDGSTPEDIARAVRSALDGRHGD